MVKTNLSRSGENLQIDFETFHKNSDGFRKILGFKNIEACKIAKSANIDQMMIPQLFKDIYHQLKKSMNGNFLDRCDNNLTLENFSVLELFQKGEYIGSFLFHDEIDEMAFSIETISRVVK